MLQRCRFVLQLNPERKKASSAAHEDKTLCFLHIFDQLENKPGSEDFLSPFKKKKR